MMHRLGPPTRLHHISRIAQILRRSAARPSFLPKVFLSLVLIGTGLFMVASDSATYASPKTTKNGGVASISPTSNGNSSASIVIMGTITPTQTATVTPTATHVSNTIPTSSYTSSATTTTTPTSTATPISGTPTPTATSISNTSTPTATATTSTSTTTSSGSEDNDADETPTTTSVSTDTPTATDTPTDTSTVTPTVTDTATVTDTSTVTPTVTDTSTVTPTVTATSTVTPTDTVTPTITPTPATGCVTSTTSSTATTVTTNAKKTTPAGVSPLLFGTNLALFNNQDQVLTSQSAQDCLQQMHISIIRVPTRSGVDEATIQQAAQTVHQIGATPLIVLHGSVDTNALRDDATIIQDMNTIFGNSTVYYEYGNNEDVLKVSPKTYTDSWNSNVPGLKKLALNGRFIGPVTYQYRSDYLHYFLQKANPQPDVISWHEYACSSKQSESVCYANLGYWRSDVQDARHLMRSTLHTSLPIMITEWNYAPGTTADDGKNTDATFMSNWTEAAIQTLASSGVAAAMQYAATNTNTNLIDSTNALTTQGSTMQLEYETLVPSSSSSGTASATPTPTPTDTVTATATPVSDTSAAATPSNAAITPSSSAVSPSE